MKRIFARLAGLGLMLALLTSCSGSSNGLLSDFTTTDLDGNEVDSSVFEDYDLTLLNVWGTFCPKCLPEMTDLSELADEYAGTNVQIIGLCGDIRYTSGELMEEKIQLARDLVEETGAGNYLHLLPSEDLEEAILNDMIGFPCSFFFDSEGNQVGTTLMLARDKDFWKSEIESRLKDVTK